MVTPSGWSSVMEDSLRVLTRSYPEGEMTVQISPWQKPDDQDIEAWLMARKTAPTGYTPIVSTNDVVMRSNIENAYYVLRELRPRRGKQRRSLLLACGRKGQIRTVDAFGPAPLFSGKNPEVLRHTAELAKAACFDDPVHAAQNEPRDEATVKRLITRPELSEGKPPLGLAGVWYLGDFVPGINGFKARQESVVVFADKTVTSDVRTFFSAGIAASKRQNSDDWGVWRIKEGDLEIKWNGSRKYSDYYVTMKARPGNKNERIEGCYSSSFGYTLSGGIGGGSSSFAVNKWCFAKNGRFSNDSAVAIVGSTGPSTVGETIYSGSSKSDKTGWYRIDGNIIQLVYDNGTRLTTAFGLGDKDTRLLLNGGSYDD